MAEGGAAATAKRRVSSNPQLHHVAVAQLVEVVRPLLHHPDTLIEVGRAVGGTAVLILHFMGQLVLDDVGAELQDLVQDGARCGAEAVPSDRARLEPHSPQSRSHCVL